MITRIRQSMKKFIVNKTSGRKSIRESNLLIFIVVSMDRLPTKVEKYVKILTKCWKLGKLSFLKENRNTKLSLMGRSQCIIML